MSQKERIKTMFFREAELSAIEIHLITGISLKSVQKRIWELRMQGVIKKTDKSFNAGNKKWLIYEVVLKFEVKLYMRKYICEPRYAIVI